MKNRWDIALVAALLAAFNLDALGGWQTERLWAFWPERVADGEWWRLLTHAWVHLSPYHLAVDGLAVMMLIGLAGHSFLQRWTALQLCALGSVGLAWLLAPATAEIGLCGLSGVAHGLTVLAAFETFRGGLAPKSRTHPAPVRSSAFTRSGSFPAPSFERRLAVGMALAVTAKAALETILGHALLEGWHLGSVGTPIPAGHLGGVIAGWLIASWRWRNAKSMPNMPNRGAQSQLLNIPSKKRGGAPRSLLPRPIRWGEGRGEGLPPVTAAICRRFYDFVKNFTNRLAGRLNAGLCFLRRADSGRRLWNAPPVRSGTIRRSRETSLSPGSMRP